MCHGQKGEIRKRYTDGQEDQLGALGLVTNAVVLWNTMYRGQFGYRELLYGKPVF
ncbi:Tn3 family transposase [Escherichia coli]